MESRGDGTWAETIEITAESKAVLIKRVAAVNRLLRQLEKDRPKTARRAPGEGTLFKRSDGLWVGRKELPRRGDGTRSRTKPIYSRDKATVVDALEELKVDLAQGKDQLDRQMTVQAWLEHWIETIAKPKMKPHPWRSYKSAIKVHIIPAIGAHRLADLRPEHVRTMHRKILAAGDSRRKKGAGDDEPKTVSTRTVQAAHTVLSSALADALTEGGLVHRNVAEDAGRPGALSAKGRALSSEEARTVLLKAHAAEDRLTTRWAAGMMLGGRQGEILGLQWERVDFKNGTLDFAWQLEWLPLKKGAKPTDPKRFDVRPDFEHIPLWRGAALTRPKTDSSKRLIPLPEPLAVILQAHKDRWAENEWGLVWTADRRPVSDVTDRKLWRAALERAEIADAATFEVRRMRDTTATLLMEAGVADAVIQSILGHSDVVMTRGYQRVNLDQARKSLGSLDSLLELG